MNANERRRSGVNRGVRRLLSVWTRLTLWPRLAIGVTLGFGILFAGFSVLGIRAVDESTNRILQERLVIAEMLARDFDGLLEHDFSDLSAFNAAAVSSPGERALLGEIYQNGSGEFATVSLLELDGRVLVSLGPGAPPKGAFLARRFGVASVLAGGAQSISNPFWDSLHRPVVALAVAIRDRTGPRAVLVGTLDLTGPAVMQRLDAARRLGRTGHAELVGPGGMALASTEFDDVLKPGEHAAFYRSMLEASKPGIGDVVHTGPDPSPNDGDGERHVMAFARLAGAPWGVALGGTDSETFAPARRLRRTLLLAGSTSLAALWLLTLLGARFLVRPVRELTGAAEEMASGNLERPVTVSEGGEIGVLGESLETMRAQLKDSLETVRRWGEELELKVAERTGELNARNRQLAAVSAVMTAANESHDLETMLRRCLDVVLEQTGADAAAIRLVDEEPGPATEVSSRGAWADFPCSSCTDRFCFDATAGGDALYLDARERERLHPACAVSADALAVLPLHGPNGVVGILTLGRRHGDLPAPDERRVLAAICDQIAVAVENARLAGELRRLEARHEVQRLRSELISAVSHELRTPLGFIKSYATTLLREDTPIETATRQQFLRIIDEETDKLEHMIDELLDASRLQAGRLPIDRKPVRLGTLVTRVVEKARPALADGHDVALQIAGEDPLVDVDELRIEQVLDNLLENASRYSDPGSEIEVALVTEDGHALLSVTDRGDGIADAELDQIFEPFYRGQNSKQRGIRGAGLGLAISRGIVEAHGGRIWVESLQGRATTFLLSIPLAETV
ncbi:MAG TPA: ATP-binding protein [Gaiellaceae bacterium]|nr:ATP-binding protein [Gaiellaceae bacterium]